ncbi:DUF6059 family protein [Kitasatospora sp. CB02891]|uniref:DUF6059 family protein n=1 Tax=Kitasatospora sp. CB02891 TaxID=2020329 RepID=UPI000C27DFF8|nr:DUF6059 family protein [Kitasatospora sp. CB02891]PJN26043.1 hypothetical protein CG736_11635 [Kitasatospora sp. CB02891]
MRYLLGLVVRYLMRPGWRALVVYGALHVPPPPLDPGPDGGGPPPGHPERLCADRPPDRQERLLWRQLTEDRWFGDGP